MTDALVELFVADIQGALSGVEYLSSRGIG